MPISSQRDEEVYEVRTATSSRREREFKNCDWLKFSHKEQESSKFWYMRKEKKERV